MTRLNITFRADDEEVKSMDELATEMGASRSEMIRQLVEKERRSRGLTSVDRDLWRRLAAYGAETIELRVRQMEALDADLAGFSIGVFAVGHGRETWLSPEQVSILSEADESDNTLKVSLGIPGQAGSVYLGRLPLRQNASLRVPVEP